MTDQTVHYIGEIGTEIIVDCGIDISTATNYKLYVQKPDGTRATWTPTIYTPLGGEPNYLKYSTVVGDFSVSGLYAIQPYIELGSWKGRGQTVFYYIYNFFNQD